MNRGHRPCANGGGRGFLGACFCPLPCLLTRPLNVSALAALTSVSMRLSSNTAASVSAVEVEEHKQWLKQYVAPALCLVDPCPALVVFSPSLWPSFFWGGRWSGDARLPRHHGTLRAWQLQTLCCMVLLRGGDGAARRAAFRARPPLTLLLFLFAHVTLIPRCVTAVAGVFCCVARTQGVYVQGC